MPISAIFIGNIIYSNNKNTKRFRTVEVYISPLTFTGFFSGSSAYIPSRSSRTSAVSSNLSNTCISVFEPSYGYRNSESASNVSDVGVLFKNSSLSPISPINLPLRYTRYPPIMDLMVISPATEKTSRTYSLNSFTLNVLPSNLNLYDLGNTVLTELFRQY